MLKKFDKNKLVVLKNKSNCKAIITIGPDSE